MRPVIPIINDAVTSCLRKFVFLLDRQLTMRTHQYHWLNFDLRVMRIHDHVVLVGKNFDTCDVIFDRKKSHEYARKMRMHINQHQHKLALAFKKNYPPHWRRFVNKTTIKRFITCTQLPININGTHSD